MSGRNWTSDERDELERLVAADLTAVQIAHRLGRTFAAVTLMMSRNGVRVRRREVKLPRGAGYDKASIRRHLTAIAAGDWAPTKYARANGLTIEGLVQALERHFPDEWREYMAGRSPISERSCTYCHQSFIPNNARQLVCSRKCGNDQRRDTAYFGGRRRETIGLIEGVCQLCGRKNAKGLSAHHQFGKENDPGNDHLVALCPGCHQLVGLLASRSFVDEPTGWEALILFTRMRRCGAQLMAMDNGVCEALVQFEEREANEDEKQLAQNPSERTAA